SERVHSIGVEHDEFPLQVGPDARLCQHAADERHVLRDVLVLEHAELVADLEADLLADLALVGFRDMKALYFVYCLLRLGQLAGAAGGLREGRTRRQHHRYRKYRFSHDFTSSGAEGIGDGTTISKIETGRVFPLTITSPRGRNL